MNFPNGQPWTPDEVIFLEKNYDGGNVAVMTGFLRRSWEAIEQKAYREGLSHPAVNWSCETRTRGIDPCVTELRQERERQRKSLDDVAEAAGFSRSTMVKWECGHSQPSIPAVRIWAQSLGLTIGFVERMAVQVKR